jgi:hypothetical protein
MEMNARDYTYDGWRGREWLVHAKNCKNIRNVWMESALGICREVLR